MIFRLPKFRRKIKRLLSCIWPTSRGDKYESSNQLMRVRYEVRAHAEIRKGLKHSRRNGGHGVTFSLSPVASEVGIGKETKPQRGTVRFRQNLESFEDDSCFFVEFKTVTILRKEDSNPTKEVMIVRLGDEKFNLIHHSENGRRLSL